MSARLTDRQQTMILQALNVYDDREVKTCLDLTLDEAEFVVEYYRVNAPDHEVSCHGTPAQVEFAERQYRRSIDFMQRKLQREFGFSSRPIVVDGWWG